MRDFRNRRNQTWVCPFQTCRVRRSCELNRASSRALIESVAAESHVGPVVIHVTWLQARCFENILGTLERFSLPRPRAQATFVLFVTVSYKFHNGYIPFYFVLQKFKKKTTSNFIQSSAISKDSSFFSLHLFLFLSVAAMTGFCPCRIFHLSFYTKEVRSTENNYQYYQNILDILTMINSSRRRKMEQKICTIMG